MNEICSRKPRGRGVSCTDSLSIIDISKLFYTPSPLMSVSQAFCPLPLSDYWLTSHSHGPSWLKLSQHFQAASLQPEVAQALWKRDCAIEHRMIGSCMSTGAQHSLNATCHLFQILIVNTSLQSPFSLIGNIIWSGRQRRLSPA